MKTLEERISQLTSTQRTERYAICVDMEILRDEQGKTKEQALEWFNSDEGKEIYEIGEDGLDRNGEIHMEVVKEVFEYFWNKK